MSPLVLPLQFKGIILFSLPEWWHYAGEIWWAAPHVDNGRGAAEGHWLSKWQILGLCRDLLFRWLQPVYLKCLRLVFPAYFMLIHPVWQCTQLTHYGSWIIVCSVWIIKQCFMAHSAPGCDCSAFLHSRQNRRSEKLRKQRNSLNEATRLNPDNENSSGLCV